MGGGDILALADAPWVRSTTANRLGPIAPAVASYKSESPSTMTFVVLCGCGCGFTILSGLTRDGEW